MHFDDPAQVVFNTRNIINTPGEILDSEASPTTKFSPYLPFHLTQVHPAQTLTVFFSSSTDDKPNPITGDQFDHDLDKFSSNIS